MCTLLDLGHLPDQLAAFANVEAWIQVACPRLSVDWGHFFDKVNLEHMPLLWFRSCYLANI